MIRFEVKQPMFTGIPAEIALVTFEELMEQQELIERGERCDRCGDLHLPEDLTQGLCEDCLMDMAMDKLISEIMAERVAREIESCIIKEIQAQAQEEALEEMAKMLKLIELMEDLFPIDMRMF